MHTSFATNLQISYRWFISFAFLFEIHQIIKKASRLWKIHGFLALFCIMKTLLFTLLSGMQKLVLCSVVLSTRVHFCPLFHCTCLFAFNLQSFFFLEIWGDHNFTSRKIDGKNSLQYIQYSVTTLYNYIRYIWLKKKKKIQRKEFSQTDLFICYFLSYWAMLI